MRVDQADRDSANVQTNRHRALVAPHSSNTSSSVAWLNVATVGDDIALCEQKQKKSSKANFFQLHVVPWKKGFFDFPCPRLFKENTGRFHSDFLKAECLCSETLWEPDLDNEFVTVAWHSPNCIEIGHLVSPIEIFAKTEKLAEVLDWVLSVNVVRGDEDAANSMNVIRSAQ